MAVLGGLRIKYKRLTPAQEPVYVNPHELNYVGNLPPGPTFRKSPSRRPRRVYKTTSEFRKSSPEGYSSRGEEEERGNK